MIILGPPPDKPKQQGFTLLELLIVLVLIGLVTGLVAPRLGGSLRSTQIKATVNRLSAMLRYARNIAVTDQKTRIVNFDSVANRVVLDFANKPDGSEDIVGTQNSRKTYGPKMYTLPDGISIVKTLDSHGEHIEKDFKLYFYPSGNSSGGVIYLKGKGKGLYGVNVNFITGLVDVLK